MRGEAQETDQEASASWIQEITEAGPNITGIKKGLYLSDTQSSR